MIRKRQGIRHDESVKVAILNRFHRRSAKEPMGNYRHTAPGAVLLEDRSCQAKSAARICDIINEHSYFARYVADQDHPAHLVCNLPFFVDEG